MRVYQIQQKKSKEIDYYYRKHRNIVKLDGPDRWAEKVNYTYGERNLTQYFEYISNGYTVTVLNKKQLEDLKVRLL